MGSMNDLAMAYQNPGRFDLSEELALRRTEICSRQLRDEHTATLASMADVSIIYTSREKIGKTPRDATSSKMMPGFANQRTWRQSHPVPLSQVETRVRI
jgi:hypothetical protein